MGRLIVKDGKFPELTDEQRERLQKLAERPDEEIDLSDIPEIDEALWKNAEVGRWYRPRKQQLTVKIDADVLAWLKSGGKGYQTRLNAILRRAMQEHLHQNMNKET